MIRIITWIVTLLNPLFCIIYIFTQNPIFFAIQIILLAIEAILLLFY